MKRYIVAMSIKKDAQKHIESHAEQICKHILKCIVYGDSLNCYDHWIEDELADWFYDIDTTYLKVDRKPPKFKAHAYDDIIFSSFGEDPHDCKLALKAFNLKHCSKYGGNYPDFEVTDQLVSDTYKATCELSKKMCRYMSESRPKNPLGRQFMKELLHEVLDKYCL